MASTDTDPALENPIKKNFCKDLGDYFYNKENGTYMGRTGSSWAKIGLFYFVYYVCLTVFFAVSLIIFYQTLDNRKPSLVDMESLIKSNPGLSFRPQADIRTTLIVFEPGKKSDIDDHIKSIDAIIQKYKEQQGNYSNIVNCSDPSELNAVKDEESDKVCAFDLELLGDECTKDTGYGYQDGKPCVLLKINKVFEWTPKLLSSDNTSDSTVQDAFDKVRVQYEYKTGLLQLNPTGVPVTCMGENYGDKDNIGELKFFPEDGFISSFFPYTNKKNYQQPLVMVQFTKLTPNVPIQVWCKIWADGVYHHKNDKAGSTHFEIMKLLPAKE